MADRERPCAPGRAALIGAWAAAPVLAALLGACSGEVVEAESSRRPETPAASAPAPAAGMLAQTPPAEAESRARALTARFREAIGRWTAEAKRLSRGKASERNVRVACHVRELGSGIELVRLRADEPQRPASNLKLVTTAAALVLLGKDAEFVTPVEALGELERGVLNGDLVARAGGDPLFDPAGQGQVEGRLRALARRLADAGLERIAGDLVLDEGSFQAPGPGPGWPDPSQHWAEYCARSGGFSANGGVLHAQIRAGKPGAAAGLEVHPSPHGLRSDYGVRTTSGGKLDVRVGATISTVTVKGSIPVTTPEYAAEFAHPDPVELFGALLADALRREEIELAGSVRRTRGVPAGVRLAELRSPLSELLQPINADSRNGVADQLFLALGASVGGEGTRAGGARAVARALRGLELGETGLVQVDGSGLSRDNRISASAITALLGKVLGGEPDTARLYRESLAVAGHTGTLEGRLGGTAADGRVFAKTGWIAGTSALSGLCVTEDARELVFSILVEYPAELGGLNTGCFKKMQDELVRLLIEAGP